MILSLLIVPALHVTLIGALGGLVGAFAYLRSEEHTSELQSL